MKIPVSRKTWTLCLTVCLLAVPAAVSAQEHDHGHDHGEHGHGHDHGGADPMAAMMAAAKPGAHHEHLGKMAGTWKTATKMWMDPEAPPATGEGTTVNTPLLGGRFMQSVYSGSFMGMPFEGINIEGYDNDTGKHVGMWIDSMGTMMMRFEGTCSDDHKTTTMMSDFKMPGAGSMKMKTVVTAQDENTYTMQGWVGPSEAQMMKSMEITYTRQ